MQLLFWIGFVATVFQDLITIVSGKWYYVIEILYNYPPKGWWIVVDIYTKMWSAVNRPWGDFFSCFSIYQITWIKIKN